MKKLLQNLKIPFALLLQAVLLRCLSTEMMIIILCIDYFKGINTHTFTHTSLHKLPRITRVEYFPKFVLICMRVKQIFVLANVCVYENYPVGHICSIVWLY